MTKDGTYALVKVASRGPANRRDEIQLQGARPGRAIPAQGKWIYSIRYMHDGTAWTATVGETLRGTRRVTTRSRGQKSEHVVHVSDPAVVLAIFPGEPYMVVTNHRIAGNVGSGWENPFLAGKPTAVVFFAEA